MKWNDYARDRCAVGGALEIVGDRWTMTVLRELFLGIRRFGEIQRNTGAAKNILADRLQSLVANGILVRELYQERPARYEYRLTEKGLDLYPILIGLMAWGAKHAPAAAEPLVLVQHRACGTIGLPELTCTACGEQVGPRDMRAVAGPGAVLKQSA
jgi:DNA-binding HxlR family transcriptional regulator